MISPLALALSLTATTPAPAAPPLLLQQDSEPVSQGLDLPFTYVEVGLATLSGYQVDTSSADIDLISVAASYEFGTGVHGFVGGTTGTSFDTDPGITDTSASTWFAGVGLHEPLAEDLVGFARLSLVGTDVDATAIGTEYTLSETNLVYSAGVRYLAKNRLELSAIGLLSADSGARLNVEASALYRVQPDIAIGLVATLPGRDEDGDSLGLGLRWYF